jgi:hypothetical protein
MSKLPTAKTARRPRQFGMSRNLQKAMARRSSDEIMEEIRAKIAIRMAEIAALFIPGSTVTVLVRRPADVRADVCVTDDELPALIEMLHRCLARDTGRLDDDPSACEEASR